LDNVVSRDANPGRLLLLNDPVTFTFDLLTPNTQHVTCVRTISAHALGLTSLQASGFEDAL